MKHVISAVVAFVVLLAAHPCMASGLILSVVQDPSSNVDLSALQAGQSVVFDVNLSGLDIAGGQEIGTLGATVVFSQSLLGTPTAISPGTIVPDPTGFLSDLGGGSADATYSLFFSNSGAPIAANGTFFTFSVNVQPSVSGDGILSLNPNEGGFVDAFDTGGNPLTINAGQDLAFSVEGSAVPEPSGLTMIGIAMTVIVWLRSRLGRRPTSSRRSTQSSPETIAQRKISSAATGSERWSFKRIMSKRGRTRIGSGRALFSGA
jgi:hypothetical protein